MDDAAEHRRMMIDGYQIFARVWTGPASLPRTPVVLVHGLGVSSRYMIPTAVRLRAYAPVYAPDLPGFGGSSHPQRALSVTELAGVLTRWMRAMRLERAVLLGNSMGCQMIAHVAVERPELVERAILVGPTMDPGAGAWAQVGRLIVDGFREPLRYLPLLFGDYLRAGPRRVIATFRHALRDDTFATYARMSIPTLVVRGGHDPIAPQGWAKRLTASLPHGRLAVIPGAGHAANFNAPDELVEVTRAFLGHSEGGGSYARLSGVG